MLSLDSPRWKELNCAFGDAGDIPALLRQLEANPDVWDDKIFVSPEPWKSLGNSICHQFDVYDAAYAVVPHIVRIASLAKNPLYLDFFCLPALIEECRPRFRQEAIPDDLKTSYFSAVRQLPLFLPRVSQGKWDEPIARHVACGLAGLKGFSFLARALIDWALPAAVVRAFQLWCQRQSSM